MLEAARERIVRLNGGVIPDSVHFVQADLFDLPFRPGTFGCVLSMGMLHLFSSAESVARALGTVGKPGASIFLSGLVAETTVGKRYLALLARAEEVAAPRRFRDVQAEIERGLGTPVEADRDGSMGYFVGPVASLSTDG